jgi:SOS-response transcriptional repressor LexA
VHAILQAVIGDRSSAEPWQLDTRALEAAGYLSGDIVIVDMSRKPTIGDVVCVQLHEWSKREASTIFRVYEQPYIVAAPSDPDVRSKLRKPLLIDNEHVIIKGVVTDLLRLTDD